MTIWYLTVDCNTDPLITLLVFFLLLFKIYIHIYVLLLIGLNLYLFISACIVRQRYDYLQMTLFKEVVW